MLIEQIIITPLADGKFQIDRTFEGPDSDQLDRNEPVATNAPTSVAAQDFASRMVAAAREVNANA